MVADGQSTRRFAHAEGGRTLPISEGQLFDPTDIEVGPDGCLYILSWGHEYGGELDVLRGDQLVTIQVDARPR